jgi:hypothetical protein
MKKRYTQSNTQALPVVPMGSICIGSVHTDPKTSLRYGGGSDGSSDAVAPM